MLPVCSSVFYDVTQQDVLGSSVQFAAARMGVGHVKKQLIDRGGIMGTARQHVYIKSKNGDMWRVEL